MLLLISYLINYAGEGKCAICTGCCCPLVNMTLKSLVEIDEIPMDTEVQNVCGFIINVWLGYRIGLDRFHAESGKLKASCQDGWKAGALYFPLIVLNQCIGYVR